MFDTEPTGQKPTMADVIDLLKSHEVWQQRPDEAPVDYNTRYQDFIGRYKNIVNHLGRLILKPNKDGTNTIVFSNDIRIEAVKDNAIRSNMFVKVPLKDGHGNIIGYYEKWFCPYHKREEEYMMRVLNPKYPEGFISTGGVLTDCLCLNLRAKDKSKAIYETKHPKDDSDKLVSSDNEQR